MVFSTPHQSRCRNPFQMSSQFANVPSLSIVAVCTSSRAMGVPLPLRILLPGHSVNCAGIFPGTIQEGANPERFA